MNAAQTSLFATSHDRSVLLGSSACGLNGKIALGTDREDGAAAAVAMAEPRVRPGVERPRVPAITAALTIVRAARMQAIPEDPRLRPGGAAGAIPTRAASMAVAASRMATNDAGHRSQMALDSTHLYWVTDGLYALPEVWRAELARRSTERLG